MSAGGNQGCPKRTGKRFESLRTSPASCLSNFGPPLRLFARRMKRWICLISKLTLLVRRWSRNDRSLSKLAFN